MKTCKSCNISKELNCFVENRKKCIDCRNAYKRSFRHGDKQRAKALRYLYNITLKDYDFMLISQAGVCKICNGIDNGYWNRLAVDHSHTTGLVRGLLCAKCNKGLGQFNDNPDLLIKAAYYLKTS